LFFFNLLFSQEERLRVEALEAEVKALRAQLASQHNISEEKIGGDIIREESLDSREFMDDTGNVSGLIASSGDSIDYSASYVESDDPSSEAISEEFEETGPGDKTLKRIWFTEPHSKASKVEMRKDFVRKREKTDTGFKNSKTFLEDEHNSGHTAQLIQAVELDKGNGGIIDLEKLDGYVDLDTLRYNNRKKQSIFTEKWKQSFANQLEAAYKSLTKDYTDLATLNNVMIIGDQDKVNHVKFIEGGKALPSNLSIDDRVRVMMKRFWDNEGVIFKPKSRK
jgi:hypothetical protein